MGVPALFRWLSKKYPKIISPVVEEKPQEFPNNDGTNNTIPVDARGPNPNGEEMDNLYLDMNGIVHPCSHPEDRPPPASEEEMMIAIFEYTDRVVKMVRPRKLLMIAVDGVAPRAKMNQQRSRRFRSAQEAAEKDKATEEFVASLRAQGKGDEVDGEEGGEKPKKTWDSNSITPGTPFMALLAECLRYWLSFKASTDPAWERMKVILSDATVPGEGEHKIMNFVRSQRSSPSHDPNTRHVIYGLDADLIMLGIATHEPHFRVLREDVFANDTKPGHCRKCNQPGHRADECRGTVKKKDEDEDGNAIKEPLKPFIWLHVGILREYLAVEMSVPGQPFPFDLERALDDWVFMCFFVGNDFLPHLPSLDIREDGIDTLIAIWRDNIEAMGGYVTKDGHVDLARAQVILQGLARQEDAIFKRRREGEVRKEAGAKRRAEQEARRNGGGAGPEGKRMRFSDGRQPGGANGGAPTGFDESVIRRGARGGIIRGEQAPDIHALPTFAPGDAQTKSDPRYSGTGATGLTHADVVGQANADNRSAAAALKERMLQSKRPADNQKAELEALFAGAGANVNGNGAPEPVLGKRTRNMIDDAVADDTLSSDPSTPGRNTPPNKEVNDPASSANKGSSGALGGNSQGEEAMPEDTVKLWEEGYGGRYYEQKFHVAQDDVDFRHGVAASYVEGLCWVLLYYFQGCPSWTWYYPYHYAPFAADFSGIAEQKVEFSKGTPFHPYEQLMGVMPPASNHTIPPVFHPLMTDEDSPIKEFYPLDFEVDLNGKKFAWQGVALLPWIDEKRLLDAMGTKYPLLTEGERRRNEFGEEVLVFSSRHPLYEEVVERFYSKKALLGAKNKKDGEGEGDGAAAAGASLKFKLNAKISEGLAGKVSKDQAFTPGSALVFPFEETSEEQQQDSSPWTSLDQDESVHVHYQMPVITGVHKSMLLPGVLFDEPVLDFNDVQGTRDRAAKSGRSFGGVHLGRDGERSDGRRIHYGARDHGGDRGRGGQNGGYGNGNANANGYGANAGYGTGYANQAANAFANLPPHLAQQAASHGFPPPQPGMPVGYPPSMPSQQGYPPQQQQGRQYDGGYGGASQNGYGDRGGGGGYGGHDGRSGGYEGFGDRRYDRGYDRYGGRGGGGGGGGGGGYGGGRRY